MYGAPPSYRDSALRHSHLQPAARPHLRRNKRADPQFDKSFVRTYSARLPTYASRRGSATRKRRRMVSPAADLLHNSRPRLRHRAASGGIRRGQTSSAPEAAGFQQPDQGAQLQYLRHLLRGDAGAARPLHRVHRRAVRLRPPDQDPHRCGRDHRREHPQHRAPGLRSAGRVGDDPDLRASGVDKRDAAAT